MAPPRERARGPWRSAGALPWEHAVILGAASAGMRTTTVGGGEGRSSGEWVISGNLYIVNKRTSEHTEKFYRNLQSQIFEDLARSEVSRDWESFAVSLMH